MVLMRLNLALLEILAHIKADLILESLQICRMFGGC
jgi:hypothetical protein